MADEKKQMKSIWFLVGLMLLVIGTLILGSGVFYLFAPPANRTVLAGLHPSLWWGAVIFVAGLIFTLTHRDTKQER